MIEKITNYMGADSVLKADGFDDAIIGIADDSGRLVYSVSKCIKILTGEYWNMDIDEAYDYFDYNMRCAYVGEQTPIWCVDDF